MQSETPAFRSLHALLKRSPKTRFIFGPRGLVFWINEESQGVLTEPFAARLFTLLAEPTSENVLLADLKVMAAPEKLSAFVKDLLTRGLIEEVIPETEANQLRNSLHLPSPLREREGWKKGARVIATDLKVKQTLVSVLLSTGFPIHDEGYLRIIAIPDYLDPELEEMEQNSCREGFPWMIVKLVGENILVGPIFDAKRRFCWRCLAARFRENRWLETQLKIRVANTNSLNEARLQSAACFAAEALATLMAGDASEIVHSIWSFSWRTRLARWHSIESLPKCHSCIERSSAKSLSASNLESRIIGAIDHLRVLRPQDILDRFEYLTSPVTGIFSYMERIDFSPNPIVYTFGAMYNLAIPPEPLRAPGTIFRPHGCSSRGRTLEEAKARCLAEGIERYSLQFRGDEMTVHGTSKDIGEAALPPESILLFSKNQYSNRKHRSPLRTHSNSVPDPLDANESIAWLPGWSLTKNSERFLPLALASINYRPPGKSWIGDADTNGCATGGVMEEAILHGLLELIERDALAIWWFNRIPRPVLEVTQVADAFSRQVCEELAREGWEIGVYDITTDVDINVFAAIGKKNGTSFIRGSAAHFDGATAIGNAITELWQLSRVPPQSGSAPPPASSQSPWISKWEGEKLDLKELVLHLCGKLARVGLEVVVFNQSRPEIALPVFRVVVPGLRPMKPRFATGRLFDVPVRMGWLSTPRKESELSLE